MGSVTNLKTNKTLFIPCDCRSEVLMIEYDHDMKIADFAIYEHQAVHKLKTSLWHRLRYCWRVLVQKKIYADQIILDNKQLSDIKTFISGLDL